MFKEKALKTTGNNDIEKMLNFGDINGNKAFVEATLDDNDKHVCVNNVFLPYLIIINHTQQTYGNNKVYITHYIKITPLLTQTTY